MMVQLRIDVLLWVLTFITWACLLQNHPVIAYKICNVLAYGAIGDGVQLDDAAFSEALINCADGGQVFVPGPGTYLLSPFNLTSNIELYIDIGATLLASANFSSYPVVEPLPSYPDDYNGGRTGAFIGGNNISNVRISGLGTLDGQGQAWWNEDHSLFPYGRPRMIEPMYCTNFSMIGITVVNPPFWGIHPYACDNLLFENVRFFAPADSPNTDGLDPDSCSNVIIRNFTATSGDDAIAIKSGRDAYGRNFNRPSNNILIEGGMMYHSRGINIGSEMSGHVYDVRVKDVTFFHSEFAVRIKTARGRGGKVYNITYENLRFALTEFGVAINMNYGSNAASSPTDDNTPHVYGIHYSNISGTALNAGFFEGLAESAVRGITLQNIDITSHLYPVDSELARFECFHAFGRVIPSVAGYSNDTAEVHVHPKSCLNE